MPVFTAAATFLLAGTALATSTFAVGALAFGLSTAASLGLNYAARALSGNSSAPSSATDHFSAQGTLQSGGDVPRSFNLGFSVTAGSLVYANTWGDAGGTPNSYFTQVIALQDIPGRGLVQVWVNGEQVTLDSAAAPDLRGKPVIEYRKDGRDFLWVNYYDGTQTAADPLMLEFVSSAERPYGASRIGTGISYVTCTSLVEDTLFTGFPTFKFALEGTKLYDISKDTTAGGSGTHRWSDQSTWGGDGDHLPAVQIYNVLRGISYNGQWIYGLQNMSAARLPATNWIAQINKCREPIDGESGPEPTYRSGLQINVNTQPVNAIETLLTACQGRLSEIGGFYKIHVGAPDSPTFSFTDADILSTEAQTFTPFFPLSDSINGITATYPNPAEGWNSKAAPPIYRTDLELRDGSRRLLANPAFDAVPFSGQVQRLMKSALEEAQRARRHALVLPPMAWTLEPGDVVEWTSVRNGYDGKLFRVDGVVDEPNLDVSVNLTEVDPSDYDWDSGDFQPVFSGPTSFPRPAPQGVIGWDAEPYIIKDADGFSRRPAIRLIFDGSLPGVIGVTYQVRLNSDHSPVCSNNTDQIALGAVIVSEGILPNTTYQVRGQYIPSAPRDMLWSDWITVTTGNVLLSLVDFDEAVVREVAAIAAYNDKPLSEIVDTIASFVANQDARNFTDQQRVRTQIASRSDAAHAEVEHVTEVMTAADAALASDILTVSTDLGAAVADIVLNATAISDLNTAFSSYQTTVTATFGSVNASIATNSTAIATLNGYAAAQYSVTLDVNGYATGFNLLNGGAGVSAFIVTVDKFQIAYPGVSGGAAVPIFTVANVNGSPKVGLLADTIIDGGLISRMIAAGEIKTINLDAQAVTAAKIQTGSITSASGVIGALGVQSLSIGDNAVTVTDAAVLTSAYSFGFSGSPQTILSKTLNVDTAGLSGKPMNMLLQFVGQTTTSNANISSQIKANGATLSNNVVTNSGVIVLSGMYSFTGTGGVVSITASLVSQANSPGGPFVANVNDGTLSAVVAKR